MKAGICERDDDGTVRKKRIVGSVFCSLEHYEKLNVPIPPCCILRGGCSMTFPLIVEGDLVTVLPERESVTHQEIVMTMMHFIAEASHYRHKQLLILDPGSAHNPSLNEIRQFSDLLRQVLGEIFTHIALVVSSDLHYGLGRMTEVFTDFGKEGFRVFRTKEEALIWLSQATAADELGSA